MKLTKQGVRDLGGRREPRRRAVSVCPHVWESEIDWDCSSYEAVRR